MSESSDFGPRLAALLDERGLTQLELAARVGVTRAAMSRYVSGDREPRFVTLVRIAEELGVHVEELVPSNVDPVETAMRLVARSRMTEDQKAKFRRVIDGRSSRDPEAEPPQYERLKSLAADLIEDYELIYPLRPLVIAELLGVQVTVHPQGLPAAAWFCDTDDGYTEIVESTHGLKHRIHVNGTKPPIRQRFTTMHEIGHVWADHLRAGQGISQEAAEGEANFLAGYLLAPDALVTEWVADLSVRRIAETFGMSNEAARIAHGRVMRVRTANVPQRDYDLRILASASRYVDMAWTDLPIEGSGSA